MFKGVKADLLFTGEMSHVRRPSSPTVRTDRQHEVLAAKAAGTAVILANHTNTERPYLTKVLQGWLQKELNDAEEGAEGNWEVVVSQTDADPLRTV
jgi:putative NIF3 family GTP cyclohydrolase 1 type 2